MISQADKVKIYAAARHALHQAARDRAAKLGSEQLGDITVEVLAAAGEAAFIESQNVMNGATQEDILLAVQVINRKPGLEYWIGGGDISTPSFGLIVADIVRHGAKAMNLNEDEVWEWVDRERYHPTDTPVKALAN